MCDQPTLGMLASHHWIGTAGKARREPRMSSTNLLMDQV